MENIVRKGEIACNKQFLLFSQCFLLYIVLIFHFKCTLKFCFNLDQSKILLSSNGLNIVQTVDFVLEKGRKNCCKKRKCWLDCVVKVFTSQSRLKSTIGKKPFENTVGKGKNADNQHFLNVGYQHFFHFFHLFPQCFLPFPEQISIF